MQSEVTSGPGRNESVGDLPSSTIRLTLNGHAVEWSGDRICEAELRALGRVLEEEVLVLLRDEEEIELLAEDIIALTHGKTQHTHARKRLITVFFENKPHEIPRGTYTTEKLKVLFGVQDGYVLEYINEEGRLTPLKAHEKLRVKPGMQFFEQVPCGGSS